MSCAKSVCLLFGNVADRACLEEHLLVRSIALQLPALRSAEGWVDALFKLDCSTLVLVGIEGLAMFGQVKWMHVEVRGDC